MTTGLVEDQASSWKQVALSSVGSEGNGVGGERRVLCSLAFPGMQVFLVSLRRSRSPSLFPLIKPAVGVPPSPPLQFSLQE